MKRPAEPLDPRDKCHWHTCNAGREPGHELCAEHLALDALLAHIAWDRGRKPRPARPTFEIEGPR